jgi:thioredoxin-like negative regulator of GroEL
MKRLTILSSTVAVCFAFGLLAVIPQHLRAQAQEGVDLFKSGQYREAKPVLRNVLKDEPSNVQAHYCLGLSLLEQGKNEDALAEITAAQKNRVKGGSVDPISNTQRVSSPDCAGQGEAGVEAV